MVCMMLDSTRAFDSFYDGFHKQGFAIIKDIVPEHLLHDFSTKVREGIHGVRNAEKKFKSVDRIVNHANLIEAAARILQSKPKIVRVILFDKTAEKNWLVSWHQDKTVALSSRMEKPGWGPWTMKDQTQHVQPPIEVLEQMVTFRVHIDSADETNGCLRVLPGSHQLGIVQHSEIAGLVNKGQAVSCIADAGDVLIMRPLILHSSGKAKVPSHRRVIHVEFSSYGLPDGIKWA